jgi:hypothetical protein
MTDNEKVQAGLRCCSRAYDVTDCRQCPYKTGEYFRNGCERQLMNDARALILEQEIKVNTYESSIRNLLDRM